MVKKTQTQFSRKAVSLAVAAALPGATLAQDANEEAIEEIVTVGIRMSVLDSTQTKRNTDVISDVIDAGPPLLAMHSPFEISSKADIWATFKAYGAFFGSD